MRTFAFAALACCALLAQAADLPFRERVIQLALIYGESSGIDLDGAKIAAREVNKVDARCSDVEVTTTRSGTTTRETVRACREH